MKGVDFAGTLKVYGLYRTDSGCGLGRYASRCLAVSVWVGGMEFLRGSLLMGLPR